MSFNKEESEKGTVDRARCAPGTYVAECLDIRINNGFKGKGFLLDFKVLSGDGATPAGFVNAVLYYPDNARGGKSMTPQKARGIEIGKTFLAVAAVLGYDESKQDVVTQEVYDYALAINSAARPASPYRGRKFTLVSVPHTNSKGQATSYYRVYPYDGSDQQPVSEAELQRITAKGKSAGPSTVAPPPAPSQDPLDKARADGWAEHPTASGWWFKGQEVLSLDAMKAKY